MKQARCVASCLGLLALCAAAAILPAASAARDVSSFSRNGHINKDAFVREVLAQGIYSQDLLNQPDLVELAVRLTGDLVPDFDFFDKDGNVVPPPLATGKPRDVATCGRISRVWLRMPFHDCATYNKYTKKGGCNGSLRLEIPTAELAPPTGDSHKALMVKEDPSNRGEFNFHNFRHSENNGFAATVNAFHAARKGLSYNGRPISWADTEVLGGILALWVCGGDAVPMVFGRQDSSREDQPGLLPDPKDSFQKNWQAFERMGFTQLEFAVLVGGAHSVAAFNRGKMDNTPSEFDEAWAKEALAFISREDGGRTSDGSEAGVVLPEGVCNLDRFQDFTLPNLSKLSSPHCIPQFTYDLARRGAPTARYIRDFAADRDYFNRAFAAAYFKLTLLGFQQPEQQAPQQQYYQEQQQQYGYYDNSQSYYKL